MAAVSSLISVGESQGAFAGPGQISREVPCFYPESRNPLGMTRGANGPLAVEDDMALVVGAGKVWFSAAFV